MSRPKRSDAYPPQYLQALQQVASTGEDLPIPTPSPDALRLAFYGLFGALRAEGKPELPSLVSITIMPEKAGIILKAKDATSLALDVEKALKGGNTPSEIPPAFDDYEAALSRILGGEKP